jgi:hypothetical protein
LLVFVDPASGEIESQAIRGLQFEGSHDSRLMVRSDGRRVEVSGNPSRFGRPDNLFGETDLQPCIDLYNLVLRHHGLPEFFLDDRTHLAPQQLQGGADGAIAEHGVRIKRIDLCECYEVGSLEEAYSSIRALSTVSHSGKPGYVYPDGCTVSWGQGSRYSYMKYYIKGPEMRKHLNQSDPYCKELSDWACSVGIIRHELSLKAMYLSRNGLDQPSAWSASVAMKVIAGYRTHDRAGLSASGYHQIAKELIEKGVPVSRARRAQEAAYAYLSGHSFIIDHNISRSAYYRVQGDLRKVGINIGAPLNVSAMHHAIKVVEWTKAAPPAFYQRRA